MLLSRSHFFDYGFLVILTLVIKHLVILPFYSI
jgi:hypothetical protein